MAYKTLNDRPNILWFSMEDTSPRFGCYGDPLARTPNIDSLAASGMRFTRAFSTAGVCAPSRSAIITGMYQTSIGSHHMRTTHTNEYAPELPTPYECVPPPYVKVFTEYLRADGYFCTNNQKTDYQFSSPITAWDENGQYAHWRNRKLGQPFFAVFNPTVTHESHMWPKEGETILTDPDKVSLPPYLPNTQKTREALARHYDNISKSDAILGELLQQLEDDGLADNTIVFLWSDHGEGLPRAKRWPYDAGIRVPLIVRWPGHVGPGSVTDELVSLVDLAPTVLSLAGIELPLHLQGRPFLGDEKQPRDYVFATRDRYDESYDMMRAVRNWRFKYIRNFDPTLSYHVWIRYLQRHPIQQEMWRLYAEGELDRVQQILFESPRPVEELYDCEVDPFEVNNLAKDPEFRDTLVTMRRKLLEWRREFGDMGEISESQMLNSVWPGGKQPVTATPVFIFLDANHTGITPTLTEEKYIAPLDILMYSATQGASIAYTTEEGDDAHWALYTGPVRLGERVTLLRAKAIRLGYKESDERVIRFITD